jgi:hypothetical protein
MHLESADELINLIAVQGIHTLQGRRGQSAPVTEHHIGKLQTTPCCASREVHLQLDRVPAISSLKERW